MKNKQTSQQGFTLIEILIAIFISSLMIGVTVSYLAGSRDLFRHQDTLLIIEENSRYVFQKLHKDITRTGFLSPNSFTANRTLGTLFYTGDCGGFNPCTADGANTDADRIATVSQPELATMTGCDGSNLSGVLSINDALINLYYIDEDPANDINSLYCRSFSLDLTIASPTAVAVTNATPILEGIENIQFLYGIYNTVALPTEEDTIPLRYVSANNVPDWDAISAVKIAGLVGTGIGDGRGFQDQASFQLLDSPTYTPQDLDEYCYQHRCRAYSSTVEIKNRF